MEIQEIKNRLPITAVLKHYHLTPDRNNRLKCPFHDDKTPSMQVYPKTGTWTCFSSNCSAGSGDQIDFIMKREGCTKHEAILKAKELLGVATPASPDAESFSWTAVLTKIFTSFRNGMQRSVVGRQYAEGRGLDPDRLEMGYNSGQYHHNGKVNDRLMASYVKYGLLKPGVKGGHQVFGKGCICFALRNQKGQVAGLYFRSTMEPNGNSNHARHFYLKDRQGLYPGYSNPGTRKLILTEAVIDAATLLQVDEISKEYGILALYGTNGMTEEHKAAIRILSNLEEAVLFLFLQAEGSIEADPFSMLSFPSPQKKERAVLTRAEIEKLYYACECYKDRTLLGLFYGCGLRKSEAEALNFKDISFRGKLVYVRSGKGKRRRVVPMPERVIADLKEYYYQERIHNLHKRQTTSQDPQRAFLLNVNGSRMMGQSFWRRLRYLESTQVYTRVGRKHLTREL
ncbi:MAG: tyrosine-type recombinase/integrase [Bacteroidales bacterium]|nr:tyrosine-type recombinase/integrase [Bacteroidales bacterium]